MYSHCCLCILIVRPCILVVVYVYLLLSMYSYRCLCILIVVYVFLSSMYTYCCLRILRRGYPDWGFSVLFLGCKANARVILAKTGHGPHSSKIVVLYELLFLLFYVLFVCKCVLPPGDNPIAVNKYIINKLGMPLLQKELWLTRLQYVTTLLLQHSIEFTVESHRFSLGK